MKTLLLLLALSGHGYSQFSTFPGNTFAIPLKAPALIPGGSSQTNYLLTVGDSICAGWNGTMQTPFTNYLTLTDTYTVNNGCIGGQTLASVLAATQSGTYLSLISGMNSRSVAYIEGGINDINAGATPAQLLQTMASLARIFRSTGATVIVQSLTSWASHDIQKNQFHALLARDWSNWADGIVDITLDTHMGCDGCSANSVDGTHFPTAYYQTYLAPMASTVINRVGAHRLGGIPYLGANIAVNGDFTSAANWSTVGTCWSIAGGVATCTGAAGSQLLYQAIGIASGVTYDVTFTVASYTSGYVYVNLGGSTSVAAASPSYGAIGTYTATLTADTGVNGNFVISSTNFVGSVTHVWAKPRSAANLDGLVCQTAGGYTYRSATCP